MAEHDVEPEGGRFYGAASVQHHRGVLGAGNCGGIWDDNAESVRGFLSAITRTIYTDKGV
jgi:hypothetical protein